MMRGDDLETLYLLQSEVDRVFDTQSVLIHDRAKSTPDNPLRFTSVSAARRVQPRATFWIHQKNLWGELMIPHSLPLAFLTS